jgi:HNH endonuclease
MATCETCGRLFQPRPGNRGRFCSRECCWAVQRIPLSTCEYCGQPFKARADSYGRFCSRQCSGRWRKGQSSNGGLHFNGTLRRWVIHCRDGTKIYFYRAVAEAKVGRPLTADELVHHVDGDTTNDDPANLAVMSRADHVRLHQKAGTMTNIANWSRSG